MKPLEGNAVSQQPVAGNLLPGCFRSTPPLVTSCSSLTLISHLGSSSRSISPDLLELGFSALQPLSDAVHVPRTTLLCELCSELLRSVADDAVLVSAEKKLGFRALSGLLCGEIGVFLVLGFSRS